MTKGEESEARRLEYQLLRGEILSHDRACMTITSMLVAVTGAVFAYTASENRASLAAVLSPLWLIGFFYLSEKRFAIMRIARYLVHIEEDSGFGWETWRRKERKKALRGTHPYYIEGSLSILAVVSIPVFIGLRACWDELTLFALMLSIVVLIAHLRAVFVSIVNYVEERGQPDESE